MISLQDQSSTRSASWWGWGEEVGMLPSPDLQERIWTCFPTEDTGILQSGLQDSCPQTLQTSLFKPHHKTYSSGFLGTWLLLTYFIISFFFIYYYFWLDSLIFSSLFDFYPHFNYLITLWTVYVMADFALTVSTFCWLRALLLPILMSFVTPGSRLPQKTIQSIHPLPTSHTWC